MVKLSDFSILRGLDEAERSFLGSHMIQKVYEPGERLIREDEINADLMFILDGCVQLSNGEGPDKVVLREEQGGVVLGELSFLDNSPRSVTVTALKRTRVNVLPRAVFAEDDAQSLRLLHHIERNIALISTQRLRHTSEGFVQSLRREVGLLREQVNFGTVFIVMVLLFGLNSIALDLIQTYFSDYYYYDAPHYSFAYDRLISWTGFLVFALPAIYLVRAISFPIRNVVDVRFNFRQTMTESSIACLIILTTVMTLTLGVVPLEGTPLAGIPQINDKFTIGWAVNAFTPDYLLHSYVQELVVRGIMQNAIQSFLKDEKGHRTVIICSLAFAIMHMHLGLDVAFTTGLGGLLFGYIYLRHKNLLGITLIHWVIGAITVRYLPILNHLQG